MDASEYKSPWRKTNHVSQQNHGKNYMAPTPEGLKRGEVRRAIEDKLLARELSDDPLFGGLDDC